MNYNTTALGKGSALQPRSNVAIFVPLDGPYEFAYGSKGQHKAGEGCCSRASWSEEGSKDRKGRRAGTLQSRER